MKKRFWFMAMFLVFLGNGIAENQVVKVQAFNNYPVIFKDADGSIKGLYVDLLREIGIKEKIDFRYVFGTWQDGLDNIQNGEVDLLTSVAYTKERSLFMDFCDEPILTVWGEVYTIQSSSINSILDIQGTNIGILKGDINAKILMDLISQFKLVATFTEYSSYDEVFKAIAAKKVDAGVVGITFGASRMSDYQLKSTGVVFNPIDIFFTTAKSKNQDLRTTLDKHLVKWQHEENSAFSQAKQKWLHGAVGTNVVAPRWLAFTLAILGAILFIALIFIVLLRTQVKKAVSSIRENEEKYRELINQSQSGISLTDECGNIVIWNMAMTAITGIQARDALGKPIWDMKYMLLPEDKKTLGMEKAMQTHVENILRSKETFVRSMIDVPIKALNGTLEKTIQDDTFTIKTNGKIRFGTIMSDITERKKTEKALLANQEDLIESQRIAHIGSWHMDIETNEVEWSEELYRMYGFDPALPPPPFSEHGKLFTPESWGLLSAALDNTKLKGTPYELELKTMRIDGSNGWMWVFGKNVVDENGKTIGLMGIAQDITERKQREEKLSESQLFLNEVSRTGKIGGWELILSTRQLIWTDETFRLHEVERDYQPTVEKAMSFYDGGSKIILQKAIDEAMKSGKPFDVDLGVVTAKGKSMRVNALGRIQNDVNGNPEIIYGTFQDITARKNAEETLRKSEEKWRSLVGTIPDYIAIHSIDGKFEYMNHYAEGFSEKDTIGKNVLDFISPESKELFASKFKECVQTQKTIQFEHSAMGENGSMRLYHNYLIPLKTPDSTAGTMIVSRDITEIQKMQDVIQRTDKLNSLGILAGGIAHDFNNLLGGIFGYIGLARNSVASNPEAVKYLDKALNVFNRAKDLTQQLLTFSSGGTPVKKIGNIGQVVRQSSSFAISGSNVNCDYSIADDLWPCDFDDNQMGQVFDNLTINAIQAMPLGGNIKITASNAVLRNGEVPMLKEGKYIKIKFSDTGTGIPKNLQKSVFDPFFTTKETGHGLGLATCSSIIKKHDGVISLESEPGLGTTFFIYLPATNKEMNPEGTEKTTKHKGKGTILVLDDEDFLRELIAQMLANMGYSVVEAREGKEAISLMEQDPSIKAIILDLTIPNGMGGKETAVLLRAKYPALPIFASSGFTEDPIFSRPEEFGFTGSIRKPFKSIELEELLERNLKAD